MVAITKLENCLNFSCWISAVFYAIYQTYRVGNEWFSNDFVDTFNDFNEGWTVFDRKQDESDTEWKYGLNLLFKLSPWYLIHMIVAELLRRTKKVQILSVWYATIGLTFSLYIIGPRITVLFILQPLFGYVALKFRRKSAIWFHNFLALIVINYYEWFHLDLSQLSHYDIHVSITTIAWINLRCLNYFLDAVSDEKLQTISVENVIHLFGYCFYLPIMFYGPLIFYSDFKTGLGRDLNDFWTRLFRLGVDLARFLGWLIFAQMLLHFVYINALSYQPEAVEKMNLWALYGLGYCMGQFFHIKYVVFYGISTCLARFEGIQVPALPKCIGRIYLYSDMWKYFDRGLYLFLLRYIYIPITGPNKTTVRKQFASFICFLYVYIWHGIQNFIAIWSILNFIGVTIESLCSGLSGNVLYQNLVVKRFSPTAYRRLTCFLATPLFAMSALSNFYFFAGKEIGDIFVYRFLQGPTTTTLIILIILYFGSQVSVQIKNAEVKKMKNT